MSLRRHNLYFNAIASRGGNSIHCSDSRDIDCSAARFGWIEVAILAMGLACRWALYISGRIALDGDEAIMGMMGRHLARLEHFPLYFYGQNYMGTIEIVPLAAIMALGTESWRTSAWPIRLIETLYFSGLAWVHFRLSARFFGAQAARWILFFLCLAPAFWMTYSMRMRHVVLMMLLGETMALIGLGAIRDWKNYTAVRPRNLFFLGLIAGLGWWHYQLIVIFIFALAALFAVDRSFPLALMRSSGSGALAGKPNSILAGFDVGAIACSVAMMACVGAVSVFSMGWWANPKAGYAFWIGLALAIFTLSAGIRWLALRRESAARKKMGNSSDGSPKARLGLALPLLGFLIGSSPALVYLAQFQGEFWVPENRFDLSNMGERIWNLIVLELAPVMGISPLAPGGSRTSISSTLQTLAIVCIEVLSLYLLARIAIKSNDKTERAGAIYYLAVLLITPGLMIMFPRMGQDYSPRFLTPLFLVISVALGLFVDHISSIVRTITPSQTDAAGRVIKFCVAASLVGFWITGWAKIPAQAMQWPQGHRREVVEMIEALERRGIDKIVAPGGRTYASVGDVLQFASGHKMRFNFGTVYDRLVGRLDETQYREPTWRIFRQPLGSKFTHRSITPEMAPFFPDFPPGWFRVGDYIFYPPQSQ